MSDIPTSVTTTTTTLTGEAPILAQGNVPPRPLPPRPAPLKADAPKKAKPKKKAARTWKRPSRQPLRYKAPPQYQQQSSMPTSKVVASTIAGSLTTVIVTAVAYFLGVELDNTAQVALTLFLAGLVHVALTFIASYMTRPAPTDGIEKKPSESIARPG